MIQIRDTVYCLRPERRDELLPGQLWLWGDVTVLLPLKQYLALVYLVRGPVPRSATWLRAGLSGLKKRGLAERTPEGYRLASALELPAPRLF